MTGKSNDNLIKALSLLRKAAAGRQSGNNGARCGAALRDLEGFLLADLKARRKRVKEWIEILEKVAGSETVRSGRRHGGRNRAAGRAPRRYASGIR